MGQITIRFETDNHAFEENGYHNEVEAVLMRALNNFRDGVPEQGDVSYSGILRDTNGNRIGEMKAFRKGVE